MHIQLLQLKVIKKKFFLLKSIFGLLGPCVYVIASYCLTFGLPHMASKKVGGGGHGSPGPPFSSAYVMIGFVFFLRWFLHGVL